MRLALIFLMAPATTIGCGSEPARVFAAGHYYFSLAPLEGREVEVESWQDAEIPGEMSAGVWLRLDEAADRPADCTVRWRRANASTHQSCRIAAGTPTAGGWLELRISGSAAARLRVVSPDIALAPPTRKPQGFVVLLDTLRADTFDVHQKLGAFVAELRRIGAYRDSLIVLASDHGEEFLDHGDRYHGKTLYEEQLRVPLVMKLPGNRRGGERIVEQVSLEDVLPTVLNSLGLPPRQDLDGRDLISDETREPRPHLASLRLKGRRLRVNQGRLVEADRERC